MKAGEINHEEREGHQQFVAQQTESPE